MALQRRVSELPPVAQIAGTDQIIVSSANATKRATVDQVAAYLVDNGMGGDQLPAGTEGYVLTYVSGSWTAAAPASGYTLPTASATVLGGVKIGSGITITDGVISASSGYTLPTASAGTLGGVKIGSGVTITDGVISVSTNYAAASHTHDDRYYTESEVDTLLAGKATPSDVTSAVAAVVNAAPASLDTLKELADALGNDANFASTVTNSLASKAPIASPTFTGTVSGITAAMVGLGNVSNLAPADMPISTATQTALDGKAASSHPHGNITNAGAIGSTSGQIVVTTTSGVLTTAASISSSQVSGLGSLATQNGTFSGTSSGTNTGDQTITLTGDVTGSGTGTFAATIANGSVTDAKITSGGLSTSVLNWAAIQPWAASTAYAKGDLVEYLGIAYRRSVAGTSGTTFNTSNWQQITPTAFVLAQLPVVVEKSSSLGNSGTSTTLSLSSSSVQRVTLNGNCTFTMPTATAGASLTVILTQGGSNTGTFTGVKWPGGTAPTITTGANKIDVLTFVSDGTNWYGVAVQNLA